MTGIATWGSRGGGLAVEKALRARLQLTPLTRTPRAHSARSRAETATGRGAYLDSARGIKREVPSRSEGAAGFTLPPPDNRPVGIVGCEKGIINPLFFLWARLSKNHFDRSVCYTAAKPRPLTPPRAAPTPASP
jgi:hypothetical protein